MIAVMYIGQRRYASMSHANHQALLAELEKIAPVVKYGSKPQTIAASFYCSTLIQNFTIIRLTKN